VLSVGLFISILLLLDGVLFLYTPHRGVFILHGRFAYRQSVDSGVKHVPFRIVNVNQVVKLIVWVTIQMRNRRHFVHLVVSRRLSGHVQHIFTYKCLRFERLSYVNTIHNSISITDGVFTFLITSKQAFTLAHFVEIDIQGPDPCFCTLHVAVIKYSPTLVFADNGAVVTLTHLVYVESSVVSLKF
jgi:hypothetical protein